MGRIAQPMQKQDGLSLSAPIQIVEPHFVDRQESAFVGRLVHPIALRIDTEGEHRRYQHPPDDRCVHWSSLVRPHRSPVPAHFFSGSFAFAGTASHSPRNGSAPSLRNSPHFPTSRPSVSLASTRIVALSFAP